MNTFVKNNCEEETMIWFNIQCIKSSHWLIFFLAKMIFRTIAYGNKYNKIYDFQAIVGPIQPWMLSIYKSAPFD